MEKRVLIINIFKLKTTICFLYFVLFFSIFGISQKSKSDINYYLNKIKAIHLDTSWRVQNRFNSISFEYQKNIEVCEAISPIRKNGFINKDTLRISIFFEQGWSQQKKDSLIFKNKYILNKISERVIQHFDSIGWQIKANREMVIQNPLAYWKYISNWSNDELKEINCVSKIPNLIIDNIGIFLDKNFSCLYLKEVNDQVYFLEK